MENIKKAIALMNTQEVEEELKSINDLDEFKKVFERRNIMLTNDEAEQLCVGLASIISEEGDMTEDDLDQVSGGASIIGAIYTIGKAAKWGWNKGKQFAAWEKKLYKKLGIKY